VRKLVVPVRSFTPLTPRTRLLAVDASARDFSFHAGQAVWLRRCEAAERRPYSIASAPADLADAGRLEFLVGLERGGGPGPHLADVAPGTLLELEGPLGGFDLPRSTPGAPVLLVAGGTGIAPLRSMWRELLARSDGGPISVVYSARASQDVAFLSELRALEEEARIRLGITITGEDPAWSSMRGRITSAILAAHLPRPADTRCAVCGPAAFVHHVIEALHALGVRDIHIATERW
jgi:ferredoxin-NADP reductase